MRRDGVFEVLRGSLTLSNGRKWREMALWARKLMFAALRGRRRLPKEERADLGSWASGGRLEGANAENRRSLVVLVRARFDEDVEASSETFRRRPALPVESEGREAAR